MALKEGKLQFGERPKMQVDSDPLKVEEGLYSEPLECMMVETTDGIIESSDVTSLAESLEVLMVETIVGFDNKAENGLESAYPQTGESLSGFQEKCRVSGSRALLCPKCSMVFDAKTTERLKSGNKPLKEEKSVVPRFVFDKSGAPQRNKEYRRQLQHPRPKTSIPLMDVPHEKWV